MADKTRTARPRRTRGTSLKAKASRKRKPRTHGAATGRRAPGTRRAKPAGLKPKAAKPAVRSRRRTHRKASPSSRKRGAPSSAIRRELEQRTAELALIHRIQEGIAAGLDFRSIVDLVGDQLRELFDTGNVGIRWRDGATGLVHYLYEYEHGVRIRPAPTPVNPEGPVAKAMARRKPLVVNTLAESKALGITALPGTDQSLSSVFVPIVVTDRLAGGIVLEDYEREHAFGAAEVQLLSTVAAGIGVALQNARHADETQRLLKETEQRNAELAVINSIQKGISEKLDFQAIIDLVGDKLREVFATGDIGIRWHNAEANRMLCVYDYEHGVRLDLPAMNPTPIWQILLKTRRPIVTRNRTEAEALGIAAIPGTDSSLSSVRVPIIGSDRVLGSIILESFEREDAYGEAEVRLLSTVAASMGIALENARLFDETQRLLTKRSNAQRNLRSSTACRKDSHRSSRFRRSTISSAGKSERSSLPTSSRLRSMTLLPTGFTSCTSSITASASDRSRVLPAGLRGMFWPLGRRWYSTPPRT